MKLSLLLLVCFVISCKPQEKNSQEPILISIGEYNPNPDEVVLSLKFVDSKKSDDGWKNEVEVIRQLRAGFGYKNRLKPGEVISLISGGEIPEGEFLCVAEYQMNPNGGTFMLKSLLKK